MRLGVEKLGITVSGVGHRADGAKLRQQAEGCRVQGAGFRVQRPGFRVQGSGFMGVYHLAARGRAVHGHSEVVLHIPRPLRFRGGRIQGLGFRVEG